MQATESGRIVIEEGPLVVIRVPSKISASGNSSSSRGEMTRNNDDSTPTKAAFASRA